MPLETEARAELRALVADFAPDDGQLMAALHPESEEPRRVYWYFKRRNVSKFEPAKRPNDTGQGGHDKSLQVACRGNTGPST